MAIWASFGSALVYGDPTSIAMEVGSDSVQAISTYKHDQPTTFHYYDIKHGFQYFKLLKHSNKPITDEQLKELKRKLRESIDLVKMIESREEIHAKDPCDKRIDVIDSIFRWLDSNNKAFWEQLKSQREQHKLWRESNDNKA